MKTKIFWLRLKRSFTEKSFSNGELVLFFALLLFWLFTRTELFNSWDDYFQFIYWGSGILIGWITGRVGFRRLKEILDKAEQIIYRPDIEIDVKYQKIVNLIHRACFYLGSLFEQFNIKQGTEPGPQAENPEPDKKKD